MRAPHFGVPAGTLSDASSRDPLIVSARGIGQRWRATRAPKPAGIRRGEARQCGGPSRSPLEPSKAINARRQPDRTRMCLQLWSCILWLAAIRVVRREGDACAAPTRESGTSFASATSHATPMRYRLGGGSLSVIVWTSVSRWAYRWSGSPIFARTVSLAASSRSRRIAAFTTRISGL